MHRVIDLQADRKIKPCKGLLKASQNKLFSHLFFQGQKNTKTSKKRKQKQNNIDNINLTPLLSMKLLFQWDNNMSETERKSFKVGGTICKHGVHALIRQAGGHC